MRFGTQTSINDVSWTELSDMWRFLKEWSFAGHEAEPVVVYCGHA